MTWKTELLAKGKLAKSASRELAITSTTLKNNALALMADALVEHAQEIIVGNQKDIENARIAGMKESLIDRLMLDEKRVVDMADGLRKVIELQDPVGEMLTGMKRPNGLEIAKVRVPFGVVGIVYESRPNVTVDAAGLCLKTGNAVILRGGSDAIESNKVIVGILQEAILKAGLPKCSS